MEGDKKTKDKKKSIRINMKELLEATELTVVPYEKLGAVQAKKDKQKNSKKLYQQLATVPTFNLPLDHKEIAAINKLAAPIRAITLLEFLNHAGIEQIKVHLSNTYNHFARLTLNELFNSFQQSFDGRIHSLRTNRIELSIAYGKSQPKKLSDKDLYHTFIAKFGSIQVQEQLNNLKDKRELAKAGEEGAGLKYLQRIQDKANEKAEIIIREDPLSDFEKVHRQSLKKAQTLFGYEFVTMKSILRGRILEAVLIYEADRYETEIYIEARKYSRKAMKVRLCHQTGSIDPILMTPHWLLA